MLSLKYPLVLASASPRRRELLEQIGLDFSVQTAEVDENIGIEDPSNLVKVLSFAKAKAVADKCSEAIVIGADTIVSIENRILGKPKDKQEALFMLKILSGKEHEVLTGVSILAPKFEETFVEITKVKMAENSEDVLKAYIDTKEPLDKAGSYGIQGKGAFLVESIEGNYHNVVGLPISKVFSILKGFENG